MELRKDNEYIEIDVNFSIDDIEKNDKRRTCQGCQSCGNDGIFVKQPGTGQVGKRRPGRCPYACHR